MTEATTGPRTQGAGLVAEPAPAAGFDFDAPADFFPGRSRYRRPGIGYRRFATAAEALRYAMESLPKDLLAGSILEIDEERYDGSAIRRLYQSRAYPLTRAA